jgi:hypothetical protein
MLAILLNEVYSPNLHHPSLIDHLNVSSHSIRANMLIPLSEGYSTVPSVHVSQQ